ncbi:MAG: peptide/nickel transport system ATP-binding protein ddpF, partial [Mycobacterium sp.]|nr:peptide/nickel transport system ATP-binding protein ddpF [Mycobacterium sp.]
MSTPTQHVALAPAGPDVRTPRARVHDLHVTFERRGVPLHALRGVSMEVQPGEV